MACWPALKLSRPCKAVATENSCAHVLQEFKDLARKNKTTNTGIELAPDENNIYVWKGLIAVSFLCDSSSALAVHMLLR
jgi:hypothetical protein